MLKYLIEREQEEQFRTTTRNLTFPDGETRRIEAYRLVWRWYDRALAYTYGPTEAEILNLTLECSKEENIPLGEALGKVLDYMIATGENQGLDYTDDSIEQLVAKRGADKFYNRKRSNQI